MQRQGIRQILEDHTGGHPKKKQQKHYKKTKEEERKKKRTKVADENDENEWTK